MAGLGRGRELTDREKYIVTGAIAIGKDKTTEDWDKIFTLSRNGAATTAQKSSNSQAVSWRSRKPVKDFHQRQTQLFQDLKRNIENQAIADFLENKGKNEILKIWEQLHDTPHDGLNGADSKDKVGLVTTEVDFRNREQFLNFLNKEANRIGDQKTRLDVLKMLSDLLRMKEAESGKDGETQRFYTPLTCKDCELYRLRAAQLASENDQIF